MNDPKRIMGFSPALDNFEKNDPEIHLLLLCLQVSQNFKDPSKKTEVMQNAASKCTNWAYLIQLAQAHSVTPLVYLNLRKHCPEFLPQETLESLKQVFIPLAWQNLKQTAELLRVQELLKTHGIQSIAYKGPILASDAYGDLGLREFVDLDLLIKFEDFATTKELLLKNGFKPQLNLPNQLESLLFRTRCEYVLIHETKNIYLEIHWLTVPRFYAQLKNFDSFFERTEFYSIGAQSVCGLRPEELLLVLSVHGAKHLWHSLKWLCDVDRLIRTKAHLNWEKVLKEAEASNVERMLLTNVQLCSSLFNTPVPGNILQRAKRDKAVQDLSQEIEALLFQKLTKYPSTFKKLFLQARLIERICDKIRFIMGTTFSLTEKDLKQFHLPISLYPLYYPWRLINLLWRYSRKML